MMFQEKLMTKCTAKLIHKDPKARIGDDSMRIPSEEQNQTASRLLLESKCQVTTGTCLEEKHCGLCMLFQVHFV